MTSDDLDRELAAVLRVEPSAGFRAQIRDRVSGESIRSRWTGAVPIVLAASVAIAAAVLAVSPTGDADRPSDRRAAVGTDVSLGALSPGATARPHDVVQPQTRHRRAAPRVGIEPRRPEVLLSASEQAGVRLLFESVASGRLELPPEMLQDLSLRVADSERTSGGDNQ